MRSSKKRWRHMASSKFIGLLGMAAKAGRLTFGTSLVRTKIQSKQKPSLVLLSSDSSDNTKKRIINCCTYYGCRFKIVSHTSDELGARTGREGSISCIAVNDEGFATAMEKAIDETSPEVFQNN